MKKYVQLLASLFYWFYVLIIVILHQFHVGGIFLLDSAREVNSNCFVCAELFTGSEENGFCIFVKKD